MWHWGAIFDELQSAIGSIRLICQPPLHFSLLVISIFEKKKKFHRRASVGVRARVSVCVFMCVHVASGLDGWWIPPLDAIPLDARRWIDSKTLLPHRLHFCQVSSPHISICCHVFRLILPVAHAAHFWRVTADLCLRPITGSTHLIH